MPRLAYRLRHVAALGTLLVVLSAPGLTAAQAHAAPPSVADALALKPVQEGLQYDLPDAQQIEKCTIDVLRQDGLSGWIVSDPEGRTLRRFLDTNGDNKVDQWCYYHDGVEVYRDIDDNHNRKADQYRWLGTAGIRWGMDSDEDGRVDQWRLISAEEVTQEVVAAIRHKDLPRFQAVLLTSKELEALQLGSEQQRTISQKVAAAAENFSKAAQQQTLISADTKWINFSGSQPGLVPAGTAGSQKDLVVYENATAVIESGGQINQLLIGTIVQTDKTWKLIDLPANLTDGLATTTSGFFFTAAMRREGTANIESSGLDNRMQELIGKLEKVDADMAAATTIEQQADLNERRADVLEQLMDAAATTEDRETWTRQLADTVGAAVQSGDYPQGVERLQKTADKLAAAQADDGLIGYVKFRHLSAAYVISLQDADADFAKIQTDWLADLEQFVGQYAKYKVASEAMLQLAIAQEFAGQEEQAVEWYGRVAKEFPDSELAPKALGAKRRIESVGQVLDLNGKLLDDPKTVFQLSRYRGRVVLIHYWATWCEPCKQDIDVLKQMLAKYGRQGFAVVGINVDNNRQDAVSQVAAARMAWPQLFEDGGLDSRLADELGILTLPTMLLIDKQGKVISRNMHAAELDNELRKLLR